MNFRWLSWPYIFLAVFILTSWEGVESVTASNSPSADRRSQNARKSAMNDSVDVEKIAFYSERDGNSEIYMINANGTGETRLTFNNFEDFSPDLSPDGVHIIFVSNRDGNREIYRMKTDGTDVVRLTNTSAEEVYPFWSADNSKIIFSSNRDGGNYEIYLMNPNGSGQTRITNTVISEEWSHLSPDMSKIAYGAGSFPNYNVYRCNANGSDVQEIAQGAIPKWSRDGNKIAYNKLTYINGILEGDFYIINADGTEPRKITNSPEGTVSENPFWSPDGKRFAFQSNTTGDFQIYVIDTTGLNQARITNHPGNDYWPSWGVVREPMNRYLGQTPPDSIPEIFAPGMVSTPEGAEYACAFTPDGTEFYFTRYDEATSTNNIWMTKLSYNQWTAPALASFNQGYSYNIEPCISPDGQKLFFISVRPAGAPPSIWYVDRIDTGWSDPQVIEELLSDLWKMGPSVAANGNLYFCQPEGSRIQIYMSENDNGVYETPVKLGDEINHFYIACHPSVAPDESYLLFDAQPNAPSSGESYLYISFKRPDDGWYPAIRLNDFVNAADFQYCASVSPDGEYLFFSRGDQDIYWADAEAFCIAGDADISGSIDISDVVYLINYLFRGGPAPEPMFAGDSNNDNEVTVADIIFLINYLFKGGPEPKC